MNRLVLIGNGFDLAHGLKTSYADFIKWYKAHRVEAAKRMTGASGHRRVTIEFYEDLEIPVLPMAEQQQIISQVEQYEAAIRQAQAIMDGCAARKKAILDKYLN